GPEQRGAGLCAGRGAANGGAARPAGSQWEGGGGRGACREPPCWGGQPGDERRGRGRARRRGGGGGGYRRRYRALKRRLKLLLYEQECFQEELRRAQRRLLRVSRDKSYLLDRLLQYEQVDDDSSDSEATASSDTDGEGPKGAEPPLKRKRSPTGGGASPPPSLAPPTPYLSSLGSPPYSPFPAEYLAPPPRGGPARRAKGGRRLQLPAAPSLPFRGVVPGMGGEGSPFRGCPPPPCPPPAPPPPAPPPVPSTVPRRLLSEGSGDEADGLDGDDELVIDIPDGQ
ncbi:LOW QUALITY PROTEIN: INO80 complex subunit E, partial [Anas platyrhynchos]|uniref:LOW QUALITY PROTEIN: INO80 complex subunit E n=1 Tax=Anas platyrhynchos TaxID=8839 RepID=UPI003AF2FA67